jgi:hypothetical protein
MDGVRQLQEQTVRVASRLEAELRAVASRTAKRMQGGMQARVRVRSGLTREHIVIVEDPANRQVRVEVADVPGRHPMLPVWIEYGTKRMPARPFAGPAADAERATYLAEGEAACAKVLVEAD